MYNCALGIVDTEIHEYGLMVLVDKPRGLPHGCIISNFYTRLMSIGSY